MQYEYEEVLVEFHTSAHPSWSRWQGADTVSHVVLWWHGSYLRELRYPQKARHSIDIYTKPLTWTLDYVYIDMAMQHARKHATYIHIYIHLNLYWSSLLPRLSLNRYFYLKKKNGRHYILKHIYTYTQQTTLRKLWITFTWMVLASMHIGGPWRSCFLSVLRYETYV